jgi:hypothetical protein
MAARQAGASGEVKNPAPRKKKSKRTVGSGPKAGARKKSRKKPATH